MLAAWNDYWAFYKHLFIQWWMHISPTDYATILILVSTLGYFLMKNQRR